MRPVSYLETTPILADNFSTHRSGIPMWKHLIDRSLTPDGRISMITNIFSDRNEIETVQELSGDDARSFVEAIDEVFYHCCLQ